jgi:hypothetical protein
MSSFERIVRPFQSKDVTPPQRIVVPEQEPVENIVIACGEVGQTRTFHGSFNSRHSLYVEQSYRELSRDTTTKRITNPDDSSQYVDVEIINSIEQSGINGERAKTRYKNSDEE